MKRIIFMLTVAASVVIVGCANSPPDLVAKINAAYHTRFDVGPQSDASPR